MSTTSQLLTIILSSTSFGRDGCNLLQPILGQPLFLRTVERVRQAEQVGPLLVLTSIDPADDPIAHRCWQERVPCCLAGPSGGQLSVLDCFRQSRLPLRACCL